MVNKTTGWKFETGDGKSGFKFKATGGCKAIAELNKIMNDAEACMKGEPGEPDEQT